MKTVYIIIVFVATILGATSISLSQPVTHELDPKIQLDSTGGKYKYIEITSVSKKNMPALYKSAKSWVAEHYGDYGSVVNYEDPESGKLIIKGYQAIEVARKGRVLFNLTIDCKDEKYRAIVSDIRLRQPGRKEYEWDFLQYALNKNRIQLSTTTDPAKKSQLEDIITDDEFDLMVGDMMIIKQLKSLRSKMELTDDF